MIPRKKRNIKSLVTSPPRKYPIPYKDKKIKTTKISMPTNTHTSIFYWILKNETNDDNLETIYTSRTDKGDTSRTDWDDSIENLKSMKNINDDDKYKEDNSQH